MNGARTKNNQEHNNNNNKKLKLKVVCAHFLGGGGEGGGGGVIPRLSATSQVGEEVRLSRRKQYRADTVGIHDMQQKKTVEWCPFNKNPVVSETTITRIKCGFTGFMWTEGTSV